MNLDGHRRPTTATTAPTRHDKPTLCTRQELSTKAHVMDDNWLRLRVIFCCHAAYSLPPPSPRALPPMSCTTPLPVPPQQNRTGTNRNPITAVPIVLHTQRTPHVESMQKNQSAIDRIQRGPAAHPRPRPLSLSRGIGKIFCAVAAAFSLPCCSRVLVGRGAGVLVLRVLSQQKKGEHHPTRKKNQQVLMR